ncbi:carbamoyl-phosphate synthase large subunit [[Clostridium] symbiosum]|uniref:carbamoyl-phosphate synthase large subunit n=1 Tax=Clostridium symbiosum TaxID=1512 RepID=UPI001D06CBE6|nr:carbamoyl-phosphate synthase large subunit [[Clostridium] symbiosum]MCB6607926.1 carbamoyl-phosphate synthase large subunit [[Clostridium] symbiosum]MCB6930427.1 carbamoyl-phosphate synthase large subunit [[Clostridium] symbiosum]
MPLNKNLKKVMVIGSGPIVIGQAAEFDYAGTQACRALKEEGLSVVLVNSNPATIMTDSAIADHVYIEPLTLNVVKRIIEKEKPDSILSTLGGQTGLTLSMELAKEGFLKSHGVTLLGASPETIDKAEDRQCFKDTMEEIGEPMIPSEVVRAVDEALSFAAKIGYPVIVRPAFTLGGTGGGIAKSEEELREIATAGIRLSPIGQILVERCIAGWKEIEFEVMRDGAGNEITVCSMENFDPVGIHTGDSIVIAPAVTLADREYQMLRSAALNIIQAMGIEGGCNCQFALNPESFEYAVIEVNPRVSRSSALASKATGYPIARVATKIAIGYRLDEIPNEVTGETMACFEPALDYVAVKFPKWPFDKFVYGRRKLGTQMKATGEVMAIGRNFEQALLKAVRGAEISQESLNMDKMERLSEEELKEKILSQDDERIFAIYESMKRGMTVEWLHELTKIDEWFLNKLLHLLVLERRMQNGEFTEELHREAKQYGFSDRVIQEMTGLAKIRHIPACYRMVDTCSAEFAASTPYFYGSYGEEDEAEPFIREHSTGKPVVMVFGSGPIRIGQGIEFDYASVHCVWSLKRAGYEVVIVNNNPETVSTDFNVADRLYFEPLTPEDVMDIIRVEKPAGAVVAFGGQTAIRLTKCLVENNIPVLGTPPDSIDMAEDRGRFNALLKKLNMKQPSGDTVYTEDEAVDTACRLGYPVLVRPSYVLGGQNMIIAYNDDDIHEYMKIILAQRIENAILIDKYLMGTELEVDAICDGEDVLIPGIMEHIERAGVHSGDSIAVYPAFMLTESQKDRLVDYSIRLALSLGTKGLINIQYVLHEDRIYIIEVNPRSSRTVPYISKVTGVPMVDLATRIMMGETLKNMGYRTGLYPSSPYYAVKVPVFSFEKLSDVDTQLGPEMKSTGEVLGIAGTMEEALYKGMTAAGYSMQRDGGLLISIRDTDKGDLKELAKTFVSMGFPIYATEGTARKLNSAGISSTIVKKPKEAKEGEETTISVMEKGLVSYVLSTSATGRQPGRDSVRLRRKAVELGIPCLTSLDTAAVLALSLESKYDENNVELIDIAHITHSAYGTGNINERKERAERMEDIRIPGYVLQGHE